MNQQSHLWQEVAQRQEEQWDELAQSRLAMRERILERHRASKRRSRAFGMAAAGGVAALAAAVLFAFLKQPEQPLELAGESPESLLTPALAAPAASAQEAQTQEEESVPSSSPATHPVLNRPLPMSQPSQQLAPPTADLTPPAPREAESALPSWHELAVAGEHRAALDAAEEEGFDSLCATASLDELLALSAAARFAGEPARSRQALTSIRSRFTGQSRASLATFALGRLEADGRGDHAEAARYFKSYLDEQPSGPLASVAMGRLMESSKKSGNVSQARTVARAYLKRFPKGAHVSLARSLSVGGASRNQ